MAIKKEELTEEQIKQLEKLNKKFRIQMALTALLYVGFLFFCNLFIVVVNAIYVKNPQFQFLGFVGTTFIVMLGVQGTVKEHHEKLLSEVKKIVGHL